MRDGGGSGAIYRPESTWARGVASGGGWFGPGRLDGGLAERAAALRMAGRRGSSGGRLGRVLAWGGAKGQARWRWRASLVHLAVDELWTRSTGGVRRAAAKQSNREERDGGVGLL